MIYCDDFAQLTLTVVWRRQLLCFDCASGVVLELGAEVAPHIITGPIKS